MAADALDIILAGVRVFDSQRGGTNKDSTLAYTGRFTFEGLEVMRSFITKLIFECSPADMSILSAMVGKHAPLALFSPELAKSLGEAPGGCAVVYCPGPAEGDKPLSCLLWKDKGVSPLVHKSYLYGVSAALKGRGQWVEPPEMKKITYGRRDKKDNKEHDEE